MSKVEDRRSRRGRSRRVFTLEQANRALTLVRRVAADLTDEYKTLRVLLLKRRDLPASAEDRITDLDQQAAKQAERIGELVDELKAVGCELKDCESGLIDFRAMHEGREVYLCWRLGEEEIQAWHEIEGGVAGRQPIESFNPDPCPAT